MTISIFEGDDKGYRKWTKDNPKGVVLNRSLDGGYKLHSPKKNDNTGRRCHHIYQTDSRMVGDDPLTRNPKICASSRRALLYWLKKLPKDLDKVPSCRTCNSPE